MKQSDVAAFHRKFQHPAPDKVTPLSLDDALVRIRLIREESQELQKALTELSYPGLDGSVAAVTGECVDLIYVALGTLVSMGVDVEGPWAEVHRANMAKEYTPPVEGVIQKPTKPAGWLPPQIAAELEKQT